MTALLLLLSLQLSANENIYSFTCKNTNNEIVVTAKGLSCEITLDSGEFEMSGRSCIGAWSATEEGLREEALQTADSNAANYCTGKIAIRINEPEFSNMIYGTPSCRHGATLKVQAKYRCQ